MITIYINAGHRKDKGGAVYKNHIERHMNIQLRDALYRRLKDAQLGSKFFAIDTVPDSLNLRQTIDWLNDRVNSNDFVIGLHFNFNRIKKIRGTEAYYSNDTTAQSRTPNGPHALYRIPLTCDPYDSGYLDSKQRCIAVALSRNVAASLGIPNRGAIHDRHSSTRSLGLLRKTKCNVALLETCYLSNEDDMAALDYEKAAQGIVNTIQEIYKTNETTKTQKLAFIQKQINAIRLIIQRISNLLNKNFGSMEKKSFVSKTQMRNIAIVLVSLAYLFFDVELVQEDMQKAVEMIMTVVMLFASGSFGIRASKPDIKLGVFRRRNNTVEEK